MRILSHMHSNHKVILIIQILFFREKFALSYSYCARTSISISYNTKVLFLSHT